MRKAVADIEANGLKPTKIWCIVAKDVADGTVKTWGPDQIKDFKDWYEEEPTILIGHNFIGYDAPTLRRLANVDIPLERIVDTDVLTRLCDSHTKKSGLAAWGEKLGHPKPEHDEWDRYSPEMLHRCIEDVEINFKVYEVLKKDYQEKGIPKHVSREEHQIAQMCQDIQDNGFKFNERAANELLIQLKERKKELEKDLLKLLVSLPNFAKEVVPRYKKDGTRSSVGLKHLGNHIDGIVSSVDVEVTWQDLEFEDGTKSVEVRTPKPDMAGDYIEGTHSRVDWPEPNLNSQQFIIKHLVRWGWKPKNFTDKGNIQLKEWDLEDAAQTIPQARQVAEWDLIDRRITMVETWIDLCEDDDRVHPKVWHIGTWTHRASHSDPNMAQVPACDKPYGPECRDLWTVEDGNVLLGCDASGIQLRVLAHYIGDPEYSKEVVDGDIHTVHLKAIDEGTRDNAKTFIYAFLLGAGGPRIAAIYGKPDKYGYELKDRFLARIPALRGMISKYKKLAKRGYIIGMDGRYIPVDDTYYTLAALLQGGETAIMRRAMILWHQRAKHLDWKLVDWVHDEWQTEVRAEHAEELGQIQRQSIIDAGLQFKLKCPMDGEYKIGPSWKYTH